MRTTNRVLSAVLGLLLLVGGVLTAVEIAIAYLGGSPWILPYDEWYRRALSHSWESGGIRGLLIAVAAVGLVLLILQFVRRAPLTLPMRSEIDATYAVRRRSLQRSLARTAERVDGVASARAKVDRRTIQIKARSNRRLPSDLKPALENAIQFRLRSLELEPEPRVRVSVRLRGGAA
jgi:hypothetical protein